MSEKKNALQLAQMNSVDLKMFYALFYSLFFKGMVIPFDI